MSGERRRLKALPTVYGPRNGHQAIFNRLE